MVNRLFLLLPLLLNSLACLEFSESNFKKNDKKSEDIKDLKNNNPIKWAAKNTLNTKNIKENKPVNNLPEKPFNTAEAIKDKNFEQLYIFMSRASHNEYELERYPNAPRIMYKNSDIAEVKKVLASLPKNALDHNFVFRFGMGTGAITIADFIIRSTNGTEDEKIALLKDLVKMGASLDMYYRQGYYQDFDVFYLKKGEKILPAYKPYIDLLKQNPNKYGKISAYSATHYAWA
jgi:hypothetical protein